MRSLFVFIFLTISLLNFGQQKEVDSLLHVLKSAKHDSIKISLYVQICDVCDINDNLKYGRQGIELVKNIRNNNKYNLSSNELKKHEGICTNILLVYYTDKNNQEKAEECRQKLIRIYDQLGDTLTKENMYFEIADQMILRKDFNSAFELIQQRLEFYEKNNLLTYVAIIQNKLGWMYDKINYYQKMVEYMIKSLETNNKLNNIKGIAAAHSQLATAQRYNGEPKKALENDLKSLEYFKKENDDRKIFRALFGISMTYNSLKEPTKALEYSNLCMEIATKLQDSSLIEYINFGRVSIYNSLKDYKNAEICAKNLYVRAISTENEFNILNSSLSLSRIYVDLNRHKDVFKYVTLADSLAKKLNDIHAQKNVYAIKFDLYNNMGDYKKALDNRLKYEKLNDSITTLENHSGIEKKALISEFEKNEQKTKEEQRIKENKAIEEKKTQKIITLSTTAGLILVFTLLIFVFRNYRLKQKSNIELEEKNNLISIQKHLVEEKQKEIIESISYAKRLQEAILPPQVFIDSNLPHNFVLYKPKDIVAGDFYWSERFENLFFIAAADSTGHGVPGAMVSVVCSNALNRALKEFKLTETGRILDKTRELVLETFEKSASEVKDGMDISLLCVDTKNKNIFWSGANNPLWYIQNAELKEIKADKQPIGKTDYPKPFTTHQIEYKENTIFYLFTDGFADQFGGPNGKKFKYKQFSDLILKNSNLPQKKQAEIINKAFLDWKGDLEQVDDVCVIGIMI